MIRQLTIAAMLTAAAAPAFADEFVICDFENRTVGDPVAMRDFYNDATESRAVVANDPTGAANKVLHVKNASWNTLVELALENISPAELTGDYELLEFDLYRPSTETDHYRQFRCYIGDEAVYDVENDFKHQGSTGVWTHKAYRMNKVSGSSDRFYLGYNSIDMEYYIDNIRVSSAGSYDVDVAEETLRYHADRAGVRIGCAVPVWSVNVDNDNDNTTKTVVRNFNMAVAENEMKPDALQPNKGQFEWYNADRLVKMAERNGMQLRGHTLVWHSQIPKWISSDGYKNNRNYTRKELQQIMKDHITAVLTHFKGKIFEWDIVNECLDDDQSIVYSNPKAYNLRKSVWYNVIGEDYLDSAFVWARRVDPDVRLYINDYGTEFKGDAKAEAYYNLVKRLLSDDIPVDGVGFQCHTDQGADVGKFENNLRRWAPLGVKCSVTELDISVWDASNHDNFIAQANVYRGFLEAAMRQDHFENFMIWGITDGMSWRKDGLPLIFNDDLSPKQAFFSLRDALKAKASTGIDDIVTDDGSDDGGLQNPFVDVYDLTGRLVAARLDRRLVDSTLAPGLYIIDRRKVLVR